MSIKIIRELPSQVEIEYNGEFYSIESRFGIRGLEDGLKHGYLEDDLKKYPITENYMITKMAK